jgi:hypothetical protein
MILTAIIIKIKISKLIFERQENKNSQPEFQVGNT